MTPIAFQGEPFVEPAISTRVATAVTDNRKGNAGSTVNTALMPRSTSSSSNLSPPGVFARHFDASFAQLVHVHDVDLPLVGPSRASFGLLLVASSREVRGDGQANLSGDAAVVFGVVTDF